MFKPIRKELAKYALCLYIDKVITKKKFLELLKIIEGTKLKK